MTRKLSKTSIFSLSYTTFHCPFRTITDQPAYQIDYTEGVFLDYRYINSKGITPVYEFGFGLSYTEFTYSSPQSSVSSTSATFSFTLTNLGFTDGSEIPQLYLASGLLQVDHPKSFEDSTVAYSRLERVRLYDDFSKGKEVCSGAPCKHEHSDGRYVCVYSIWDVVRVVPSDTFDVFIGEASIKDIHLTSSFTR
ncbi:hypothetical protein GYMLUDRAFT_57146 [Collybiopsis luxurians FD-317 M1]|uniref:beta-glucosidase n=1 Tax=Collybiopsis luxurians FD-317 M1 TaxID=944289 RepID=A0A0D0CM55_9AGAR|nr:hypothetical protein GYMLUDRAFT_57146 [Collybiopsis luxurians FD-317 M1]